MRIGWELSRTAAVGLLGAAQLACGRNRSQPSATDSGTEAGQAINGAIPDAGGPLTWRSNRPSTPCEGWGRIKRNCGWCSSDKGSCTALVDGVALSDNEAIAVGRHIVHTRDRGRAWTLHQLDEILGDKSPVFSPYLTAVWASAPDNVIAVGCNNIGGALTPGFIVRSIDRGKTWSAVRSDLKGCPTGVWGTASASYVYGPHISDSYERYTFVLQSRDGNKWSGRYAALRDFEANAIGGTKGELYLRDHDESIMRSRDRAVTFARATLPSDVELVDPAKALSPELRSSADVFFDRFMMSR